MLLSLNLCASCAPMLSHDCYLTSHSFRAHTLSQDFLALTPFLTQLPIPILISHAIFARSLTLPSSSNLSRNLYCSLSHMHTGRGRTWRSMTRPCPWSILAKYIWSDHRLVQLNVNKGCGAPLSWARCGAVEPFLILIQRTSKAETRPPWQSPHRTPFAEQTATSGPSNTFWRCCELDF